MALFGKKDETRGLERDLMFFQQAMNREPTVEELDTAIRVHKLSWKEYCNKMIEQINKQIELEKERQKTEKLKISGYEEAVNKKNEINRTMRESEREKVEYAKREGLQLPASYRIREGAKAVGAGAKRFPDQGFTPAFDYAGRKISNSGAAQAVRNARNELSVDSCPRCGNPLVGDVKTGFMRCINCNKLYSNTDAAGAYRTARKAVDMGVSAVESQENRMPRAIAFGKREIDRRAAAVMADYKPSEKLDEIANDLGIEQKYNALKDANNLKKKFEKEMNEILEKIGNKKETDAEKERLALLRDQMNNLELRYEKSRVIFEEANNKFMEYSNSMSGDLNKLKHLMEGIVPDVHTQTCASFGITRSDLREEVKYALEKFADEEAAHMIENANRTIYSGLGKMKKFAHGAAGYGKSASGTFAKTSDVMGMFTDATLGLVLGPALIGAFLVIVMGYEMEYWGPTVIDIPLLLWVFVPILIIMMMELGKAWR